MSVFGWRLWQSHRAQSSARLIGRSLQLTGVEGVEVGVCVGVVVVGEGGGEREEKMTAATSKGVVLFLALKTETPASR